MIPLLKVRLLAMTNKLMILNVLTIIGCIVIALGRLASMSSAELVDFYGVNATVRKTEAFASDLTLLSFFHSQALFAFAYMGVFIYLEIISEMREPKDFRKSLLWFSGPFQFLVYGLTGAIGYALIGSGARGLLIKQIPTGTAYRFAGLFLAVHMGLTFMVKGTILSRAIHAFVSPSSAKDFSTGQGDRVYALVSAGVLAFCLLVANLVPFFDDLTAFLGAMQTPFIGFILPILYVWKARKNLERSTPRKERFFMFLIIFSMMLLFFVGIVSSVGNIIEKWKSYGAPFSGCF